MTKEQIGALFEAGPLCCGTHERAVTRLLEERRRLLEALHREHDSDTGLSQESLADIAFAEADTEDAAEPQEKQF